MSKSENKNCGVPRTTQSKGSLPNKILRYEQTVQEQISLLSETLLSPDLKISNLDFKYPPPAIRAFIRHANNAQLTGILLDVIIALDGMKPSNDNAN